MRTRCLVLAFLLASCVGVPGEAPVPSVRPSVERVDPGLHRPRVVYALRPARLVEVPPTRPVVIPSPRLIVRAVAVPRPVPTRRLTGSASWFCGNGSACTRGYPGGLYAAAGPALRIGQWRGRVVIVSYGSRRVAVQLVDWCACPHRLLDLYRDAFSRLADPSRGVLTVKVTW